MDGWNNNLENWEKHNNVYNNKNIIIDVIVVLAGGLDNDGKLHEWVKRRLDRTIELNKMYNVPIICCGGGTYHKPPYINKSGFVIHESTECVNYLIQNGINSNIIFREWSSYDTIANAFFSLTNHIFCRNWKNIAIVTSEFHIERTKEIFDWVYNINNNNYNLTYYSASDYNLNIPISRIKREKKSKENIIKLRKTIKTLKEFHEWIYVKHNAYNNNMIRENISEECKKSY